MPTRKAYLDYLASERLSEKDVLPAVGPEMRSWLYSPEGASALGAALGRNDQEELELAAHLVKLTNGDSNDYLVWLDRQLRSRLMATSPKLMRLCVAIVDLYPGVFPLNGFNAHLAPVKGGFLVLMNTGIIEMNEAVCALASMEITTEEKADRLVEWVQCYCDGEALPSKQQQDHPSLRTRFRNFMMCRMAMNTQEFVLAHEYGHAVLHRHGELLKRRHMTNRGEIEVVSRSVDEEFEADLFSTWALSTYIREAAPGDEAALAFQLAGPLVFLSFWYLVEQYMAKKYKLPPSESHPPAGERICAIETLMRCMGLQEEMWLGGDFIGAVEKACGPLLGQKGIAPIWDRSIVQRVREFTEKMAIPATPVMGW